MGPGFPLNAKAQEGRMAASLHSLVPPINPGPSDGEAIKLQNM